MDNNFYENINNSQEHAIICRFEKCFINENISVPNVQIYLTPISPESDVVISNPNMFYRDRATNQEFYSAWGNNILEFMKSHLNTRIKNDLFMPDHLDQMEEFLKKNLQGKLLIVYPLYQKNIGNTYYKKIDQIDGIAGIVEDKKVGDYLAIPHVDDSIIRRLQSGEQVNLPNWDSSLFGIPRYLETGNNLVKISLESVDNFNTFAMIKGTPVKFLKFLTKPLIDTGDIIALDNENSYRFFSKRGILNIAERNIEVLSAKNQIPESASESAVKNTAVADSEVTEANLVDSVTDDNDIKIINQLWQYMRDKQLDYSKTDICNFHACVKSGILTIIAGMSGTGKTRLPLEYASFFNLKEIDGTENKTTKKSKNGGQMLFLPVSPSYTTPADILGYYNPMSNAYVPAETGLVDLLVAANRDPKNMYMVIFDEMNLARIEFYLSPILSVMEKDASSRFINLYSPTIKANNADMYPPRVNIGSNVILVGTINVDDTSTPISDRLLDRSFVINLQQLSFAKYSNTPAVSDKSTPVKTCSTNLIDLMGKEKRDFTTFDYIHGLQPQQIKFLDALRELLNNADQSWGVSYREAKNISIYLHCAPKTDSLQSDVAFDIAVRQTIMKKLRGSRISLSKILLPQGEKPSKLEDLLNRFSSISNFNQCREEIALKLRTITASPLIR